MVEEWEVMRWLWKGMTTYGGGGREIKSDGGDGRKESKLCVG